MGAKALNGAVSARLKPCPDTKRGWLRNERCKLRRSVAVGGIASAIGVLRLLAALVAQDDKRLVDVLFAQGDKCLVGALVAQDDKC